MKIKNSKKTKETCSRRRAFRYELRHDWDSLNFPSKVLLFIGIILFILSISILFIELGSNTLINSIEVIFRTSLSSIFGFFLSSSLSGNKKDARFNPQSTEDNSLSNPTNKLSEVDDIDCKLDVYKYNYHDSNLIRILLSCAVALICIFILWLCMVFNIVTKVASITQLRDLMCSSIGFLLGESRIKKD